MAWSDAARRAAAEARRRHTQQKFGIPVFIAGPKAPDSMKHARPTWKVSTRRPGAPRIFERIQQYGKKSPLALAFRDAMKKK